MNPERGAFVVLEGIDGAGTTTQAARLESWLRAAGRRVLRTREPSDGPIGVLIRQILRGRIVQNAAAGGVSEPVSGATVALLFAADRLDHLANDIAPALAAGIHVVSDRYVHSSLAYQALDVPADWVRALNARAQLPDLTIFLSVRPAVALERIRVGRAARPERFEERALLERVDRHYRACLGTLGGERVVEVDGEAPPDAVFAAVRAAVAPLVGLPTADPAGDR